jgi:cytochrome o ubiquinol oxidase operon protein cyoD
MSEQRDGFDANFDDVPPGAIDRRDIWGEVRGYLIGLGLAVLLTAASFYMARTHEIWGPSIPIALFDLAIAQMGIHLVFFLHITTAPDNTNNILALAFGLLIVGLIVLGSLWIMYHLNQNMLPIDQMIHIQR